MIPLTLFSWLFFFSGSCHYGNLSDIGLFFHSSNIILVAVRNASSNMTSALTSLSLTDKSGILNIQFMMTLSEVISISLAYSRLHYWRLPPVWPLYSDLIFWIILLFSFFAVYSATVFINLTVHSIIKSLSDFRMLHVFLFLIVWLWLNILMNSFEDYLS